MDAVSLTGENSKLELLRRPFPPKLIERKPGQGDRRFVSHGHVTDRLIAADPDWTWKPERMFDFAHPEGNCWIEGWMEVGGVRRWEYGHGKNPMEAASHFIRRAAMRFGVGLDLWLTEESESAKQREAGGEATAYGEGAEADPPASPSPEPERPNPQPSDAQRWMEEFHPGKPHKMKRSETVPKMTFCTQGNGKCPYAVMEEAKV